MAKDQLEDLIDQAHGIFGKSSIYEIFDLDREEVIEVLFDYYGLLDMDKVERYFSILEQIRAIEQN